MFPAVAIPALAALVFKAVLLGYSIKSPVRTLTTRVFLALLVVLALHNLVEVIGFVHFAKNGFTPITEQFGFAYIALLTFAIALILHVSLLLSFDFPAEDPRARLQPLLYAPPFLLIFLLLFTDLLVVGFQPFQNTILRVPGPFYFLFETYIAVYFLAALVNLVFGARSGRPYGLRRTRNRLWLLGLLPTGLLLVYLIVANHFGWTKITSTIYIPITLTFFLIVTTYATHQYRLFDIEFFVPWSRVRKRKTAFYRRIQAMIAEIAEMRSVRDILEFLASAFQCQVALVGGLRPLMAFANGQQIGVSTQLLLSKFPREALEKVDQIVVANEIADRQPQLYSLMKQYKVGAIVPFNSHSATSAHWMLLGERFSDQVYTPLDFRFVEALFDKIAERFLDNLTLLRSQLADARDEIQDIKRRLALAWDEQTALRRRIAQLGEENRILREEKAQLLRRNLRVIDHSLPQEIVSGQKTLDRYLSDHEAEIVAAALRQCRGNSAKAARLLGIWPNSLAYLLERLGLKSRKDD